MSNSTAPIPYATASHVDKDGGFRGITRLVWHAVRPVLLTVLLFITFVGLFFAGSRNSFALVGSVAAFVLIVISSRAYLQAARRREALRIVAIVAQGVRLNAPLPAFLQVYAIDETTSAAKRLRAIAALLESGSSIGDALGSELPALPVRQADLLRLAETNGTLDATLRRVDSEAPDAAGLAVSMSAEGAISVDLARAYLAIVLATLVFVILLMFVAVVPRIDQIMRDFGMRQSPAFREMIWFAGNFGLPVGFLAILLAIMLLSSVLVGGVDDIFFPTRQRGRVRRVLGNVMTRIPVLGALRVDRDYADACHVIADALEDRRPIDAAIRGAASMAHLSSNVADRLDTWGWGLTQGLSLSQAARGARIRSVVVNFLSDTHAGPDGFRFLSTHFRTRSHNRMRWLQALVVYTMPIALGFLIGWFAIVLFEPLWGLIDVTSPYKVGL